MNNTIDKKYMNKAIELAKNGKYRTHPNPLVGAVIVKNDKIISKGYHKRFRGKHAEREAIDKSKESLKGSTMYVTLEPCAHYGNTPPCVDAIIDSKISRVVIASKDPNPLVNEKSINKLKDNGIDVTTGVCESDARELNKSFFYKFNHDKPYMRLKYGISIDGKIANQRKESKWITSADSRTFVQSKRAEVNAILTTCNTVIDDNPYMNIREKKIKDLIKVGVELGVADDIVFNRKNSKRKDGAIGILTGGLIDRTKYYEEAVVLSLIPFLNKKLFS